MRSGWSPQGATHAGADEVDADREHDIETGARDALAAVRETVSGYRTLSLDTELEHARSALAAASLRLDVIDDGRGGVAIAS